MPTIELNKITKDFGQVRALDEVTLRVNEGDFVSLIGPSGCGKTTFLRITAGLEKPSSGKVVIDGKDPFEACKSHCLGLASQRPALVPSLTALANVQMTLEITGNHRRFSPKELLTDFGLGDSLSKYPHQLSGGMQQRANIACALVHQPQILLLDEPFGALDEFTRESLGEWLTQVLATTGQTVLFVTHSIEEAVFLSNRIVLLTSGGKMVTELTIPFPRPRQRELRAAEEFLGYVAKTRKAHDLSIEDNGGER